MRQLLISGLLVSACLPLSPAAGQSLTDSVTNAALRTGYGDNGAANAEGDGLLSGEDASGTEAVPEPAQPDNSPVEREQGGTGPTSQPVGPYDPLGVRVGQFLFYPSLTLWGELTDNVDSSTSGQEGRLVNPEFELRVESDWGRHSLSLSGSVGMTAYDAPHRKPANDQALNAELGLDLASETELTLDGSFSRLQEDSSVELDATGQAATYETSLSAGATLDQRLGQLDLQLRGSVGALRYEGEANRNYDIYRLGARVGVPVTDQVMPFVDAEVSRRQYSDTNNRQNGNSLRGAIGIEVVNREKLSGEVSAGLIAWDPEQAGQSGDATLFADASLVWSPNGLWTIRGGLETELTSTATAARSVATHRVSASAEYAILRNLTFTASGDISRESYNGLSRRDWVFDATLNATYSFNRNLQLIASVERSQRESNWVGEDTETNTVRVGLKLQR